MDFVVYINKRTKKKYIQIPSKVKRKNRCMDKYGLNLYKKKTRKYEPKAKQLANQTNQPASTYSHVTDIVVHFGFKEKEI